MSIQKTVAGICFLTLLALASCNSRGKNFLKARGDYIVNAQGDTVILRGMGLGGWMLQEGYMFKLGFLGRQYRIRERIADVIGNEQAEKFYEQWLANHTRRADIDSLAAWGFNSIRLPMHYNLFTLPVEEEPVAGGQTWLEKGFVMTDSLLAWCKANQLYLILDLHAAPGGQGNDLNIADRNPDKPSFWESEANRAKAVALWRKLAERYADEEWIGGYDVLNETNWGFEDSTDIHGTAEKTNKPLRRFFVDVTHAIRQVDSNHIIFLEGNGFANNYNGIFPLWDDNLVLSFHKYGNFNTQAAIQKFLDLRKTYHVPLWLGESGENSNTWFTEAIALCEQNHIGWAWWQGKKMGINNPLEIKQPASYQQLLDYWGGNGLKPARAAAEQVLNELLENLKLESNVIHRDVLDAMFRQVGSHEAQPFSANLINSSATVQATDFDLGRQGVAYFDKDTASYQYTPGVNTQGNRGHAYRNDGVDIRPDGHGFHVFDIQDGEWLQYTVNVTTTGKYGVNLLMASATDSSRIGIETRSNRLELAVPHTGSDTSWRSVAAGALPLQRGTNTIRIQAKKGGFTFKSFTLMKD